MAFARTPAAVEDEMAVALERTLPTLGVLVVFHPPGPIVYGKPVPAEAEATPWLLEDDAVLRVSVNVNCAVT